MADDRQPVLRQVTDDLILIEVGSCRILAAATCPHRRGRLRFGYVDSGALRIRCPLHHSTFELPSGRRVAGPACQPLRIVAVLAGSARPDGGDALAGPPPAGAEDRDG